MSQAIIKTLTNADGSKIIYPKTAKEAIQGLGNIIYAHGDEVETTVENEYLKYTPQSFTDDQKAQARNNIGAADSSTVAYKTHLCNPNLLDNWYFGNPVNQRGQTSYNGGYTIDRWKSEYSDGQILLSSDGLVITNGSSQMYFLQNIEGSILGKAATFSVLTDIGLFTITKETNLDLYTGTTAIPNIGWIGFRANDNDTSSVFIVIDPQNSITLKAAKLELGDTQTLAHQDSTGTWVLNEIPNYTEQLARCQRYQLSLVSGESHFIANGVAWGNTNNQAAIMIPIQVPMRTAPALSSYSVYKLYVNGSEKSVTSLSVLNLLETGIRVRVEANSAFTAGATIECMLQNVFLDANL